MVDYVRTSESPVFQENYEVDRQLIPLLLRMSRRGILLQQAALESWETRLSEQMMFCQDICGREGFDPAKNQQVGYMLALRGNMLPFTRKGKQLKVDQEILSGLGDPLAAIVLQYRDAAKLLSTYIRPWLGKKRAYTNFRQDLATGRLASFNRNIQNIPSKVREIFVPDSGTWTWMDWSQIEMRIFAHLTQDPVMLDAYRTGKSIHGITQEALWPGSSPDDVETYLRAKTFNFAMIYYASARTLAKHSKLPEEVCARYRVVWLDLYYIAHRWMDNQIEEWASREWVETIFDRRLRLPSITETSEAHVKKCTINYPVQGSAAGVVARGMLMCKQLGYDTVAQVHDELLFDGDVNPPDSLAHIVPGLDLPFTVSKSPVWI